MRPSFDFQSDIVEKQLKEAEEISVLERTKKALNMLLLIMLVGVYGMRVISKF